MTMQRETMHDREASRTESWKRQRYVRPDVDIFSTDSEVLLLADVPGVPQEDLDLRIEGNELVIEGKAAGREESESRLPWGYYRRFRLSSAVERDRIQAKLEGGVLRITLGKVGAGRAKKVEIE